jgi:hypothetical protein
MKTVTTKFKYPNWVNEMGEKIGENRDNTCKQLNEKNLNQVRPKSFNVVGGMGEVIYLLYLFKNDIEHEANLLFGNKPIVEHDVIVKKEYFIDVKGIRVDGEFFTVNKEAHEKVDKYITHYVFVKLHANNECDIYRCAKEEVDSWQEVTKILPNKATSTFYSKLI